MDKAHTRLALRIAVGITMLALLLAGRVGSETNITNGGEILISEDGVAPDWSPDGTKIAFKFGGIYKSGIWVMDTDGNEKRQIDALGYNPDWSPDGTKLTFIYNGIWVINVDGTGKKQIGPYAGSLSTPHWSPTGDKISYFELSANGGDWDIYTINEDGSNITDITNGSSWWETYHTWSPDGTKIAFATGDGNGIWVMNSNGSNRNQLISDTFARGDLDWSPDGTKIAYATDKSGDSDIWIMNSDGTGQTQLTSHVSSDEYSLSWSPDGTKIVYSNWPGGIVIITLNITNILPRFINGTVMESANKTGITGVRVSTNTNLSTTTNESGFYSLAVTEGTYNLTARLEPTYYSNTTTVSTIGSEVVIQDIELLKKVTGNITGSVTS